MTCLKAGCIDVDELRVSTRLDAGDTVPGRLRLARGDADIGTDEHIHQGRFADIGSAADGDVATTEIRVCSELGHADLVWLTAMDRLSSSSASRSFWSLWSC